MEKAILEAMISVLRVLRYNSLEAGFSHLPSIQSFRNKGQDATATKFCGNQEEIALWQNTLGQTFLFFKDSFV